jgi:small subunit ribosomal protein S13
MVRIGNTEIPVNKKVAIALTSIYGVGKTLAEKAVDNANIENQKKVCDLTEQEIKLIGKEIEKFVVGGKLKEKIKRDISKQVRIGTYRGLRHSREPCPLPVNGQSTRHNGRTARLHGRRRQTVAGKKKAPTAK